MRKLFLTLSITVFSLWLFGQNENPYSQFGYEAPIMPEKQLNIEDFSVFIVPNSDTTSNISFLSIDVKQRRINLYSKQGEIIEQDTLLSYTTARWLTPDPAGQFHSPYLGMGNNPVSGVDPDGAWWFTDNSGNQVWKSGFWANAGALLSSKYTLNSATFTNPDGSSFRVRGDVYFMEGGQPIYLPGDMVTITGFRGLNWMGIAKGELGVTEIAGAKHNPRVLEYLHTTGSWWNDDETPWCSGFTNWTMVHSGNGGTNDARALSWKDYGQGLDNPAYGSIGIIDWGGGKGHVGLVAGQNANGDIVLLGGNQSNMVKYSAYPRSKFTKFVYPNGRTPNYNLPVLDVNGVNNFQSTR